MATSVVHSVQLSCRVSGCRRHGGSTIKHTSNVQLVKLAATVTVPQFRYRRQAGVQTLRSHPNLRNGVEVQRNDKERCSRRFFTLQSAFIGVALSSQRCSMAAEPPVEKGSKVASQPMDENKNSRTQPTEPKIKAQKEEVTAQPPLTAQLPAGQSEATAGQTEAAEKAKKKKGPKTRIQELREVREQLSLQRRELLEREQELESKEQTLQILQEELALEKKLRGLLTKEKQDAVEEARLAMGLCAQMIPI
ncbi:hypothetical protein CYMTET_23993 [Cymbomonas tetramitiformis]|uniref:Uncharacterized protein n=1 Tax=Cymbomonas tetramitiformis TaxID=36881 RepID=A0AAE0L0J4_9CHLO|nr:hypothetical protein CYMTET_23993 [Cymbomonas tetramitiformis]